ncbi:MAG: DUF3494 domain-containing protein [Thermoplasmata archaeon]|nr:DUF3494 domain-containing protein [Thermoplasmata archaeon]
MSIEHPRTWIAAMSLLVTFGMLFAAFAVAAPPTYGSSVAAGSSPASSAGSSGQGPNATCGQSTVPLGSASSYAVLAAAGVSSTGPTAITGDLGVGPGSSVTGFPPGTLTGTENIANTAAVAAEANVTIAFNDAFARSNCAVSVAGNIGGQTLTPGLYASSSTLAISSGDLTLSAGGNSSAIFVFQVASALTTTSGRLVILTNGTQASNIFWVIGTSATLGTTSVMQGTLLAGASITMATGAQLNGRALARVGAVTLEDNTIVVPTAHASTNSTTSAVNFEEHGLPTATNWSVTLAGSSQFSLANSISFTEPNGSYLYLVGSVSGFVATPSSGTIVVLGAALTQTIAFAPVGSTGRLSISVVPATASVTLDGRTINGTAGTYLETVAAGPHYVNATLSGHASYSNLVSVAAGVTISLSITLAPILNFGYLTGTVIPTTATVIASGFIVPVQNGAFNVSLAPGAYYLSVTATGYQSETVETSVSVGHVSPLVLALTAVSSTVTLSGRVTPSPGVSVVADGFAAFVNASGYYRIFVVPGAYTVSASAPGYFPDAVNLTIAANATLNFRLTREPVATSTRTIDHVTATGYNVTVTNVVNGNRNITVTYTSLANGTLLVAVPYAYVQNATLAQLLASHVDISGVAYTNFTVSVSANYTVTLTVRGLAGDPALSWTSSGTSPAGTSGSSSTFLGLPGNEGYYLIAAIVVVIAVIALAAVAMRRRGPPAPKS